MTTKTLFIMIATVFGLTGVSLLQGRANTEDPAHALQPRTITVEGTGTVLGKPDSARIFLTVVTTGKTVAGVREENSQVVGRVQAAILALKLPDLKSRTRDSSLSIEYADRDRLRIAGYQMRHSFSVVVTEPDVEKLGQTAARVLDVGLENGVNSGGSVEFFKADDSTMKRLSMTKAVEDALANAQAHATGANVKLTNVLQITNVDAELRDRFGGWNSRLGVQGGIGGGGEVPSFATGDWAVSSKVRIVVGY